MTRKVALPLIEMKSNLILRSIFLIYLIGFLGLFFTVFVKKSTFLLFFFFSFIVVFALISRIFKKYKNAGILLLSKEEIEISSNEIISIKDVKDFKLSISGYDGKISISSLRGGNTDEGIYNFLEFYYKNEAYKFQFLLSYNNYKILNKLIEIWKNEKAKFKINN